MLFPSGDDAIQGVQEALLEVVIFEWKIGAADLAYSTEEKMSRNVGAVFAEVFHMLEENEERILRFLSSPPG